MKQYNLLFFSLLMNWRANNDGTKMQKIQKGQKERSNTYS